MAKKPEIVSSPRRNSFHGVEDAGQTWAYKDIVTCDPTTGEIKEAVTTALLKVLGQAQAAATGVTGAAAVADEWFDGDLIAIDCWDTSGAAVEPAASFIKGVAYGLLTEAGEWYADIQGTGIKNALIFVKPYGDLRDTLVGSTITRGLFRIADGICVSAAGTDTV